MSIRPRVKKELLKKIKKAYPEETNMLASSKTVEWALNKVLEMKI